MKSKSNYFQTNHKNCSLQALFSKHLSHLRFFKAFGVSLELNKCSTNWNKTFVAELVVRGFSFFMSQEMLNFQEMFLFRFPGLGLRIKRVNKVSWDLSWAHAGRLGAILMVHKSYKNNYKCCQQVTRTRLYFQNPIKTPSVFSRLWGPRWLLGS